MRWNSFFVLGILIVFILTISPAQAVIRPSRSSQNGSTEWDARLFNGTSAYLTDGIRLRNFDTGYTDTDGLYMYLSADYLEYRLYEDTEQRWFVNNMQIMTLDNSMLYVIGNFSTTDTYVGDYWQAAGIGDITILDNVSIDIETGDAGLILDSELNRDSCIYLTEGDGAFGTRLCNDGSGINRFVIANERTGFEYMVIDRDSGNITFNNDTIFATNVTVYVTYLNATATMTTAELNTSYIRSILHGSGMDIRGDPWYLTGAGFWATGDIKSSGNLIGANIITGNGTFTGDVTAIRYFIEDSTNEISLSSTSGLWNGVIHLHTDPEPLNNLLFVLEGNGTTGIHMPHFWVQNEGPGQASGISRSWMIVDEIIALQNTTNLTSCRAVQDLMGVPLNRQVDCNTSTTGADLIVGDDFIVGGDIFLRDTDGEFHNFGNELQLRDNMLRNTTLTGINGTVINGNLTIQSIDGTSITVNIDANETILGKTTDSILLTEGTNESPIFNQIFYTNINDPSLSKRTTLSEEVTGVAAILYGDNFTYASIIGATTTRDMIKRIFNRFLDDGSIYKSGFNITVTTEEVNISHGEMKTILTTTNITQEHSTSDFYVHIHANGSFHQHLDLDDNDMYTTGELISNNKYFNKVCGIAVTHDTKGVMYCITQNKPDSEHTKVIDAELDIDFLQFFPANDIVKKAFIPIVRVVVKRSGGSNTIQTLSTGHLYIDLRGTITASAGGTPSPSISSHPDLANLDFASSGHTGFLPLTQNQTYYDFFLNASEQNGTYNIWTTGGLHLISGGGLSSADAHIFFGPNGEAYFWLDTIGATMDIVANAGDITYDLSLSGNNVNLNPGLGHVRIKQDNKKFCWGLAPDACIYYNASTMLIDPKEFGSGYVGILGNFVTFGDGTFTGNNTVQDALLTDFINTYSASSVTFLSNITWGGSILDRTNNRVGIGKLNPAVALDIIGNTSATGLGTFGSITNLGNYNSISEELIDDPGFDNAGSWTLGTGWSVGASQIVANNPNLGTATEANPFTVVPGALYRVEIVQSFALGGSIRISIGGHNSTLLNEVKTHIFYLTAKDTTEFTFEGVPGGSVNVFTSISVVSLGSVDGGNSSLVNLSVKWLIGGHIVADSLDVGDGNITGGNIWLPTYCFAHTNDAQNVTGAGSWLNVSFDQEISFCTHITTATTAICGQPNATSSYPCGGLSTGTYELTGDWSNGGRTYDDNFATAGGGTGPSDIGNLYINYTKPRGAVSATWDLKDGDNEGNYTIPSACFDYYPDRLSLRVESDDDFPATGWYCFDGSWSLIVATLLDAVVYEETIYWDIIDSTNDTFIIQDDGVYEIDFTPTFSDTAASPDGHVEIRITRNGTEIDGSAKEMDSTDQYADFTFTSSAILALTKGDEIRFEFTSDDSTIGMSSHNKYAGHKTTAKIRIKRTG